MMKFFPTLPPMAAEMIDFGHYHFVQAHHLKQYPEAVMWYYDRGSAADASLRGHWTILDNGAWELKEPDVNALLEMVGILKPHEIVVPDSFTNKEATLRLMVDYFHAYLNKAPSVMIVPQGQDIDEWLQCAECMRAFISEKIWNSGRVILGIPKVVETYKGGRYAACEWLMGTEAAPSGGVHLLGVWNDYLEVMTIGNEFPIVRSVDTTLPYAWAMRDRIASGLFSINKIDMQPEWWQSIASHEQAAYARINIAYMERMVDRDGFSPQSAAR